MWKVNTRDWGRNHRTGEEKKQMGENATSLELLLQGKKYANKSQTSGRYEVNSCSLRNTLCYSKDIKRSWINFVV